MDGYDYSNISKIPLNHPHQINPYIYLTPYMYDPSYFGLPFVPLVYMEPFRGVMPKNVSYADVLVKNDHDLYVFKAENPLWRIETKGQHMLMTREQFTDWLFNNEFDRKIEIIQQHHTWKPDYNDFDGTNHFSLLRGMEYYHIHEVGLNNIAQNITTFPDGTVAISRPFDFSPQASVGIEANKRGVLIENVGNFDIGYDVMTEDQKETIVYITALLCIRFGLTPSIDSITYHRWWDYVTGEKVLDESEGHFVKTCPGTGFFGGNTTEAAQTYFYPLVLNKMLEILGTMH